MKVLSISLDSNIIDPHSLASVRNQAYGGTVDRYVIVVPHRGTVIRELGDRVSVYGVSGWCKPIQFLKIVRVLNQLMRREGFDVVSSADPYFLGLLAYLFAKQYRCGLEVQLSGIEKLTTVRRSIGKFVTNRAGSVRVGSLRLKDTLQSLWGIPQERVHYVPILIPHEHLVTKVYTRGSVEGQRQHAYAEDFDQKYRGAFNVLSVTELKSIKNVPLLIRACKTLIATHSEVTVHIVGDGPQRTALSALIKNLGISDHVILHGNVDRMILSVLYAKANCFVLPSRSEGWTLSIIEAMASRVPVIMTDVGFAGEVIKHEKNGLVVPVDGEKALTQALELLMSNVALRKRLSESAYAYFENYWTSDRILAGYKESWHNALIHK